MDNLSCEVFLETLEQGAVYLEAGGAHMSANRIRLIAEAVYRQPDIFEMLQDTITDILAERIQTIHQEVTGEPGRRGRE